MLFRSLISPFFIAVLFAFKMVIYYSLIKVNRLELVLILINYLKITHYIIITIIVILEKVIQQMLNFLLLIVYTQLLMEKVTDCMRTIPIMAYLG